MEKKTAIALAQKHAEHSPAPKYFITTDEAVHTDAGIAAGIAMHLSAGNPKVFEVLHTELDKVPEGKTPVQKVAAAKVKIAEMQAIVDEKTKAKETAEGNKKGAATVALKKAIANLETAKKELVDAEALTEE